MIDHQCFAEALKAIELPPKKSNRGYEPEQLVTQFSISVWCAANRFEHAEVTRHAPVLRELFGFKTMANFQAIWGYSSALRSKTMTAFLGTCTVCFLVNSNSMY
jgi:hypothetical protein